MWNSRSIVLVVAICLMSVITGGCAHIPNGEISAIKPVADPKQPRVGHAYLFRGFIGVFSTGMNTLGEELNHQGVTAHVYQADQWSAVADAIEKQYRNKGDTAEPIVLVGHSYGADNILRIAQKLKDKDVQIDLLVTLDPVTPPKVPGNVKQVINLYQSNGALDALPWLRGIPLEVESTDARNAVKLANLDIRKDRTDLLYDDLNHFNIEKKEKVHGEIIKQIKQVCMTRQEWAARKVPQPMPTAIARTAMAAPAVTPATRPTPQHAMAD